jgi:tRNA pseudouridine38-40 synthase
MAGHQTGITEYPSRHKAVAMRNVRIHIAYDGTDFYGWQRQKQQSTIQGCLEAALEKLLGTKVALTGSGRTDAGVHASGQVANFKTTSSIPAKNLQRALNDLLPATVKVTQAEEVSLSFHARFCVRAKTYRYRILQAPVCVPFVSRFVYHYPYSLDRQRMARAAQYLHGEHDFTSFAAVARRIPAAGRAAGEACGAHKSAIRNVFRSRLLWRPRTSILVYEVSGNGFLRHMVRNIVGTLIEAGRGRIAPQEIPQILEARDRSLAGPTAPACGLSLVKVEY